MQNFIQDEIQKLAGLLLQIQNDKHLLAKIQQVADVCVTSLKNGGKILFAGNGGSAADSQHLAAELVSRLKYDRPGLSALALTTDTSALTAIGNDYSFEYIFARQLEAVGKPGDIFIGISTSGKSSNIIKALETAKRMQIVPIGFSGTYTANMATHCEHVLSIPSCETPKIQECHIMLGHIICAAIENQLFGAAYDPMRLTSAHTATN